MRKVTGIAVGLALATSAAPAQAWEPTKPVEIVVAAGAGGASDQMARMIQAAIQKNGLMKAPMVVSLKGGASGAEALKPVFLKGQEMIKFLEEDDALNKSLMTEAGFAAH